MDSILNWFEARGALLPNYFWIIIALIVLVVLLVVGGCLLLTHKNKKIKTLKAVLNEEGHPEQPESCKCGEDCKCHDGEVKEAPDVANLVNETEALSRELTGTRELLTKTLVEKESLVDENENLKKRIVELEEDVETKETMVANLDEKLKDCMAHLDMLKAKNVENSAEIASYKATNDILSKSIDNLKVQIADKNDEIELLKVKIAKLADVEKKATEAQEDNKVLMRAVSLIMNSKDEASSDKVILNETAPAAKPVKKEKTVRKVAAAKTVEENLETMKRPDLMHLAKREGVKRFARKSNDEIIRLIRENRKTK